MPTRFNYAPAPDLAPPFSPLSISGLVTWHDFSDATKLYTDLGTTLVTADGDAIEQCNDKSGNAYHLTQTGATERPLYKTAIQNGKSVSLYDGSNDRMFTGAFSSALTQPYTVLVVFKYTTAELGNTIYDGNGSGRGEVLQWNSSKWAMYAISGPVLTSVTVDTTAFHYTQQEWNGASSTFRYDGSSETLSSTPGTHGKESLSVGSPTGGGGVDYFFGYIGEIMIYNALLTALNITDLDTYLKAKWGL